MDLFFSTVVRDAPPRKGGELVKIDWETQALRARTSMLPFDPNLDDHAPGSSTRGGRGIVVTGDEVIAASYHSLQVYDLGLQYKRKISHPWMAGLHEVWSPEDGTLWVACTAVDAVFQVDLASGELLDQIWLTEMPAIQEAFGVSPFPIDKGADLRVEALAADGKRLNRLHANAVAGWREHVYVLLNKVGGIVDLKSQEVVVRDDLLRGCHNLVIRPDGCAFVNQSQERYLLLYDLNTRKLVRKIDLLEFKSLQEILARINGRYWVRNIFHRLGFSARPPRPLFVRGMAWLQPYLFVGISPAAILCVDVEQNKLVGSYSFSDRPEVCIHGLAINKR